MSTTQSTSTEDLQNRGPVVLTVAIVLFFASFVFVTLRLVSRIGIVKKVTWDDHFIVLAWLIAFGFSFAVCWGTHVGLGHHEVNVPVQNQAALRKSEYAFSVLYNPALMATKTSILIFYLSLAKNQQLFRWACIATLVVVNVAGLALTFLNIFQCHPVAATFKDPIPSTAICTDLVTLYLSSAPVNIITDLAILFLPMPILTGMRLPRKQKIILIITFSFGVFVAVVDVVRIAYLQSAFQVRLREVGRNNATTSRILEQDDFSWYASYSFMWSAIEVHVGILCSCVPALKPLVSKVFPKMLHSSNDPHTSQESEMHFAETATQRNATLTRKVPPMFPDPAKSQPDRLNDENGELGMMEFSTTADITNGHPRPPTALTDMSEIQRTSSFAFFDFVNMNTPKSMVKMSNRESILPLALVTILFFLWGVAYGFLNILNSQFQLIVQVSTAESLGLHATYWGGYLVGPLLFGRYVLKTWGFKATFIVGLCIYGCGTLVFWPSAVLTSFPAFLVSNFIIGLGLATLEVGANPFIALCGPPNYAEVRLNVSQGVQAIGSIVSPLLAQKVMFKNVSSAPSLLDAQWAYLGIGLFDVSLAIAFYYLPIPEVSDDDLEEIAGTNDNGNPRQLCGFPTIWLTLGLGMVSQFCYVGAQESVAVAFESYVTAVKQNPSISPFDYEVVGHTVFAVGRFLTALTGLIIRPRWILLFLFLGAIVTSALAIHLTSYAGIAMLVLILFFESGIFSLIFAMCLRGLGRHTKTGSALITTAIGGGALFPFLSDAAQTRKGIPYSFCVVAATFACGALFPIYLSAVPAAKRRVDPLYTSRMVPEPESEGHLSTMSRSRVLEKLHSVVRRKKTLSDLPSAEHMEGDGEKWPD